MEGMVSKEAFKIQSEWVDVGGSTLSIDDLTNGLAIKLLGVTYGQWLYRNIQVHDMVCGSKAVQRNKELQNLVEDQIEL